MTVQLLKNTSPTVKFFVLSILAFLSTGLLSLNHAQTTLPLTDAQKLLIGNKIWHNEGLGKIDYLSVWNEGEEFPSFGIGHFIWYPENSEETFIEQFPQFLNYAEASGSTLPSWLKEPFINPWQNREHFYSEFHSDKMLALRQWLVETIPLQIDFILLRMEAALPKMLVNLPAHKQKAISHLFHQITAQPSGPYALIDYINFKGEGTSDKERYQGQGWGLLQVLENMNPQSHNVMEAFVISADEVLTRRTLNAPRDEKRWLKGWRKRIQTYLHPLTLD